MSIQRQALIHAARLGYQQLSNIVMRERMGHAVGLVPGVLGDVDAAKIADQVEAMTKQREAPPGQAREALEAARGWIVGVAHRVGGHEVVEKIDEALAALSAPTEQVPAGDVLRVLANVIGEYDRNLCTHEETHRGGAIWTICDGCGRKWADDRGGFEPYKDPASVEEARAMLAASPSAPTAVQPADDALTPTERAACQQCGSDPHKMSCTVGGKDQLRLTAVATPTAVKEAGGVDELLRDVGREMVALTTTVHGPDEWPSIPFLWKMCADERDRLREELQALRATPTAVKEAGGVDLLLRQVFEVCEATEESCGGTEDPFRRGRAFEAKSIRRAIGTWFQDEFCGRSFMGEPAPAAAQPVTPVAPRAFRTPEPGTPWWQTAKDCGAWTDRQEGDVGYIHFGSTEALRVYTVKIANQVRESLTATSPAASQAPKTLEALTDKQVDAAIEAWFSPEAGGFQERMRRAIGAALAAKNNMTLGGE